MTRRALGLDLDVEYLQILDENGKVDKSLEPKIPKEDLLKLYRTMLLVRAFDENRMRLQRSGQIGTFAPCRGQEAAQLGSIYPLRKNDWFVPSFRESAAAIWRGMPMENDLLYASGYEEGMAIADDAHDFPISIPIGTQITHAVGLTWAAKLQGKDEIGITYIGDGGTSEGDFHEAMNFATVYGVPLIVMCQNNQWAISVPREQQTKSETIAQKAWAYQMPCIQVDGNDILAVIVATQEAAARARAGEGPTFIEAVTYRMSVHTTADDPSKYRSEDEVKKWEAKDPIERFRKYLVAKKYLTKKQNDAWLEEVKGEVKAAVDRFRDMKPDNLDNMFEHAWHELPAYTRKQKEEFEERWARDGETVEVH